MKRPLLPIVIMAALGLPHAAIAENGGNDVVDIVPINQKTEGKSYGEWAARWWEWVLAIPRGPGHPLFDETGADCGVGQSGNVWFLGGVFNRSHEATRDCTIPPGHRIFFPVLNTLNVDFVGQESIDTEAILRAELATHVDTATDLAVEIDGQPLRDPWAWREQSPLTYPAPLPANNLFGVDAGSEVYFVDDGFYLMLLPLSLGDHTIHFHGRYADNNFTLDVTYRLHIGKRHQP